MRIALLALSLLVACDQPPPEAPPPGQIPSGGEVLVTVDGKPVTQKLIDIGVRPLTDSQREAMLGDPERMRDLIDRLAFAELLYQRAVEEEIYKEQEVKDSLALAQREILANIMLERIASEKVTDEAVKERYESMAVQFERPSAKVQHILVKRQDEAEDLIAKINDGEMDFLEAARRFSVDRSVQQTGGDLGWRTRAPAPELREAWDSAEIGAVVGPIEGKMGFHILKVTDRRDSTPLDEVRDKLEEMLRGEAMQAARPELMNEAEVVYPDDKAEAEAPSGSPAEAPATDEATE